MAAIQVVVRKLRLFPHNDMPPVAEAGRRKQEPGAETVTLERRGKGVCAWGGGYFCRV